MDNKKLGIILITFSLIIGGFTLQLINKYSMRNTDLGCMTAPGCQHVGSILNYTHLVVGVLVSLLSLGLYMLIFHGNSESAVLKKLEEEKNKELTYNKFELLFKTLDSNEGKVLKTVKDSEGISQNMIKIRAGLSKSKVSQILTKFERKNIIKREPKGKTYSVYLNI